MSTQKRRLMELSVKDGIIEDGITTYQIRPYTIVEIFTEVNGYFYRGVGMAKLGKNDRWNSLLGYDIAYGRAVQQVIKEMNKQKNEQR